MSVTRGRHTWRDAAFVVFLAACATGSGLERPERGATDFIAAAEMEPWAGQDLYVVIQRLRPKWFQTPKAANMQGPLPVSIIIDGLRQGGSVEILRSFRTSDAQDVRFLSASDATTLYGTGAMSGAIVITTKR